MLHLCGRDQPVGSECEWVSLRNGKSELGSGGAVGAEQDNANRHETYTTESIIFSRPTLHQSSQMHVARRVANNPNLEVPYMYRSSELDMMLDRRRPIPKVLSYHGHGVLLIVHDHEHKKFTKFWWIQ